MSAKVVRVQLLLLFLLLRIADHEARVILRARDGRGRRSDPWDINVHVTCGGPSRALGATCPKTEQKEAASALTIGGNFSHAAVALCESLRARTQRRTERGISTKLLAAVLASPRCFEENAVVVHVQLASAALISEGYRRPEAQGRGLVCQSGQGAATQTCRQTLQ